MPHKALAYNPPMLRRLSVCILPAAAAALATLLALGLLGCAHDANAGKPTNSYPPQVNIGFRTQGSFDDQTWYYMVFNFTAAPSIDDLHAPFDFVSGESRGKNWEMYIAYHRDANGVAQITTLQRQNIYTLLGTKPGTTSGTGPTDCAVDDFDKDGINDIAIACHGTGGVQIIRGKTTEIYKTTYFRPAEILEPDAGFHPTLLYSGNLSGGAAPDLAVLYTGDATKQPFLRVLKNNGAGVFTALAPDVTLDGTPIDALLMKLDSGDTLDLAVLTTDASGTGTLRIYTGNGAGLFVAQPTAIASDLNNPVQLATGHLDSPLTGQTTDPADLVVANHGDTSGTGSSVRIFKGGGTGVNDGTFTEKTPLSIPGPCEGVAVAKYFGSMDDIGVTYVGKYQASNETKGGVTAVYMNEADSLLGTTNPVLSALGANPPGVHPNYMLALDTGNMSGDPQMSSVVLSGKPGSGGRSIYIQRSDGVAPIAGGTPVFSWVGDTEIVYQTELGPARIRTADVNKDGILDFIIPCPNGDSGTTICVYYGLGKSNYTSADIYWTDGQPQLLGSQRWLIGQPVIGPNSIQLSINPEWFYDLAQQAPYAPQGFNVDFMTADSAIDINDYLPPYDGVVTDSLSSPVNVKLEHGFLDNEQNSPRAQHVGPTQSQDIIDWLVEVI
jgi:hypothetical protein